MIRRTFLLACLAVLSLCACSSGGASTPHGSQDGAVKDPVGALAVSSVPAGFTEHRGRDTGPTDLATAVRDDGWPAAAAALRAQGFQHGYQRLWTNPAGDTIGLSVYRFATAAGAGASTRRSSSFALTQADTVVQFTIPGLPRDTARAVEVDVEGNRTDQVFGTRGRYAFQLVCASRTSTSLRATTAALTRDQYAELPEAS